MTTNLTPAQEAARMVDSLGPAALAKAQAYTVGGEWVSVLNVLVAVLVALAVVRLRLLDRIAARFAKPQGFAGTLTVSAAFLLVTTLIGLPWTIYTDWYRERAYDLSRQPLGDFLGQLAISEAITTVVGGLFLAAVYALIRRTGRRWWLWSGGLAGLVTMFALLAGPVLIEPLFNDYKPVPPGAVRTALEKIADDVDIPHDRIFMYDGSRQSDRVTANVAGIGPSARIAISDAALKKVSLDEVRAVTGHEAGHYKLGHAWRLVILMPLLAMLTFFLLDRLFAPAARWMGSDAGLEEARGLPVFVAVGTVVMFLATPPVNAVIRTGESEADAYSLRTVNEPDALATALVKTAEYRYPRPSPLEEFLFYTHPSVEKRALMAMEWKAAHPKPAGTARQ